MDKRFLKIIFSVFFFCFVVFDFIEAQTSMDANATIGVPEQLSVNQQAPTSLEQHTVHPSEEAVISAEESLQPAVAENQPSESLKQVDPLLPVADGTQGSLEPVEIDGDNVEFMQEENKVVIDGHVSIVKGDTTLRADHMEYFHATKLATAKGHVILSHAQGEIRGDALTFNFGTMTGDFQGATIVTKPYYGKSEFISKVDEKRIEMTRGYITTCDLDKPHYKMYAKKVTMYPGDKVKMQSLRMVVGKLPLFYLPEMTQVINSKKPMVVYTPGYDKDWGAFLLTTWSYYFNDNFKGKIHLDYREKKDFASGIDLNYKIPGYGEGLIKTYYMNERNLVDRIWESRTTPTVERERFKAQWRHQWQVDKTSQVVLQYYKLSDQDFLKDYFERENDRDPEPDTYFLFTKNLDKGTFSFRLDKRVNRFFSSVERLPELGYTLSNQQIANSNFYLESNTLLSSLQYPSASPSDVKPHTVRLDLVNRISYPTKVGFVEFTPFVGQRETFYTRTKDGDQSDIIRSIFETGAVFSTKFYKTFDVEGDFWGMTIHKLRHIINPKVQYQYINAPTFPSDKLDIYDSTIDNIVQGHKVKFSLENRFQTKRNKQNVDLLRIIAETDFLLKEDQTNDGTGTPTTISKGGFNTVKTDVEFRPMDWLTFHSDSDYSAQEAELTSANFEIYLNHGKKWGVSLGKRYHVDVDDEITGQLSYMINPNGDFLFMSVLTLGAGGRKSRSIQSPVTCIAGKWILALMRRSTREAKYG